MMFKRKKKKTGVQTPELRKTTPPPPHPTSGSNAVKPNPNYIPPASVAKPRIYGMNLEDLDNWVKTIAQIGDVAYYHDRILDHHYIYRYRKPDDNPIWTMMNPDFLEKYSKKDNKGDNKMNITGICAYETPCGWCTKWDKKCDRKINKAKKYTDERLNYDLHYECLKKTLERDIKEIRVTSEFHKYLEKRYIFSLTSNRPAHCFYPEYEFMGIPIVVDDSIESSYVIVFKKEDVE